jgi:hypothetical protein
MRGAYRERIAGLPQVPQPCALAAPQELEVETQTMPGLKSKEVMR